MHWRYSTEFQNWMSIQENKKCWDEIGLFENVLPSFRSD